MKFDDSIVEGKKKKGGNYTVERKLIGKGPTMCNAILPYIVAFIIKEPTRVCSPIDNTFS
jgi:hypothetical protein